ncbi:MAG: class II fructose-1,6-bisphosphate aldolase [Firmicutes bacterium]|jgi:fructose-bisphosphate aldolase class II|nr:class II fructose-1,6-bisphosphate aldolase [Bacillota bacterium]
MALVTSKEMFAKALKSDYAVGAFNVNNMEIIQGIVDAVKEENAPVILQVSAGARKYARPAYLMKLVEAAVIDTGLDICLHLDHGEDFEICKKCVDDGFTSVMIDGSKHPYEENIALTKQVVEYAHAHGVVVEAELGKLAGVEDNIKVDARSATFTDPEEAAEFVQRTGVDSLAIAIGTSHGAYKFKGEPYLDFERLKTIHNLIPDTPLVLHGASTVLPEFVNKCNQYGGNIPGAQGVPEDMIRESTKWGICKVNIDTDLRLAMTAEVRKFLIENPAEFDPRKYLSPARAAIQGMVQHKIKNVLNASGKR